ncbi:MAG: hypothetical protein K2X82_26620 [Gemmataceae bacterium]|nr:hypothetical protein [Gemmataceae bacterium]
MPLFVLATAGLLPPTLPDPAGGERPRPAVEIPLHAVGKFVEVRWLGFAPDGRHLAVRWFHLPDGARVPDERIEVFESGTGASVAAVPLPDADLSTGTPPCLFTADGDHLAYGGGRFIHLVPVSPRAKAGRAEAPEAVGQTRNAWMWPDPAGRVTYFAPVVPEAYSVVRADNRADGSGWTGAKVVVDVPRVEGGFVIAVAHSPAGRRLALSIDPSDDGKSRIDCWALGGDKPVKVTITPPRRAEALGYSSDGKLLATGDGAGSVGWYDAATGENLGFLRQFTRRSIGSVAFAPDGRHLAFGASDEGSPNLFVLDLWSGEVVSRVTADPKGVTHLTYSPDGLRLAVAGESGTVGIWNVAALLKPVKD